MNGFYKESWILQQGLLLSPSSEYDSIVEGTADDEVELRCISSWTLVNNDEGCEESKE